MKHFMIVLLVLLIIVTPVLGQAEETCNEDVIAELVPVLQEEVAALETYMDLLAFSAAVNLVVQACQGNVPGQATETSTTDEVAGLSRSTPVVIGDWFTFDNGQVRVESVEVDAEVPESHAPEEGLVVVAVNMEYLCQLEDPDTPCRGIDVYTAPSYITAEGEVMSAAPIYLSDNIGVAADGHEVYTGGTITGRIYFTLLEDEALSLMRISLRVNERSEPVFFALAESEEE